MVKQAPHHILTQLENAGYKAYLVGGCVRDLLLGREPNDWDITTSGHPTQVMELFGDRAIPTGLKHGTVTIKEKQETVEVTTFRIDGTYSDSRHPDLVTFAGTVEEDLARRDFTVNAMALAQSGDLVDPFGGQEDLVRKVIRCVGKPEERFEEDALRILRALRFASVLDFIIEEQTTRAIHKYAHLLRYIAAERILSEMDKLLCGAGCGRILLEFPDVLGVFIPELLPCVHFDQQNVHHCYDLYEHSVKAVISAPAEPVMRWTMLLHDIGKVNTFTVKEDRQGHFYGHAEESVRLAEGICHRLRMRRKDIETILTLIRWHDRNIARTRQGISRAAAELGEENFLRLLAVKRADNRAQAVEYHWVQGEVDVAEHLYRKLMEEGTCLHIKDLAVNGHDLMALGYVGKEIGIRLEFLLQAVIAGELTNDRETLLEAVRVSFPQL